MGGVLVEDDAHARLLRVIEAGQAFHEIADFFPLIVVTFEKVEAVLDWCDCGAEAIRCYFRAGG